MEGVVIPRQPFHLLQRLLLLRVIVRILFVAPYVPSLVRIRPFSFVKYLSQRHEVTVVAQVHDDVDAQAADLLRHYCARVETVKLSRSRALLNCALAIPTRMPLQAAYCRSNDFSRLIRVELEHGTYDLVHVEHLRGAQFALAISGLPVVYDAVDCITLLLRRTLRHSKFGPGKALAWWELTRNPRYEGDLVDRFDRVLVTSPEDRRALLELSSGLEEERVLVIPNGVHLARSGTSEGTREPGTITFSGKMSYHANVDAITYFCRDILPLVKREVPGVKLTIVGSQPPREVRALGEDPSIKVTGHVPDVRPYIEKAVLAVCPVRYAVGIQNKVLEAMAMGTPVVATSQACKALTVTPGRELLVADSQQEFARHVVRLLRDPVYGSWVAANARRYVEANHEWRGIVDRLESVYRDLIDVRQRNRLAAAPEPVASPLRSEVLSEVMPHLWEEYD